MRRPLILIVEDDRKLRELFRAELRIAGYDSELCEDGVDALRFIDNGRPDAIVLDLDLPRLSGANLYDELRRDPRTRGIPIVICTGVDWPLDRYEEAIVLRKPCAADDITAAIAKAARLITRN